MFLSSQRDPSAPLQLLLLPFAFVVSGARLVVYLAVSWRLAQLGDTAAKGGRGEGPAVPSTCCSQALRSLTLGCV